VSLKLYRPGPDGLEPASVVTEDYRTRLRSRRWRLPPLRKARLSRQQEALRALRLPERPPTQIRLAVEEARHSRAEEVSI
jgi:hypothetical protein